MKSRKEMKKLGRASLKSHYLIFVAACLLAAFLSSEFHSSLNLTSAQIYYPRGALRPQQVGEILKTQVSGVDWGDVLLRTAENHLPAGQQIAVKTLPDPGYKSLEQALRPSWGLQWEDVLGTISQENLAAGREVASQNRDQAIEKARTGSPVFGRTRGVLANLVNQVTSGSVLVTLVGAAASITGSESAGLGVLILLAALGLVLFWVLVQNLFPVVIRRVFLEGMIYQRVTLQRFMFLLRVGKWLRAAWVMLVKYIYYSLWCLTVVGMVVKRYSYYLVPYIVAENPTLSPRQAITLSRRMMKGHKWECFVFELSFLGWEILGALTLGLLNIFYTNPYKVAAFTQYYAQLRALAIENQIPGWELLQDRYLFEAPSLSLLHQTYGDVLEIMEDPSPLRRHLSGWRRVLADNFGVLLLRRPEDRAVEAHQAQWVQVQSLMDDALGQAYPVRLCPIPEEERRKLIGTLNYMRHYSLWSLLCVFLGLSIGGWLWEVGLHLVSHGELVNRGVLHGPWLPIYGTGAVLILTVLYRFRRLPALEFTLTVVLCGVLEYGTSVLLELATGGTRWWDYSGYFLNLHGRICAEGLLAFGIGGLAIVYVIAPVMDNLLVRLGEKKVVFLTTFLTLLFFWDGIYSLSHPNTGRGVTDIEAPAAQTQQLPDS